jgi:hypothetical protein
MIVFRDKFFSNKKERNNKKQNTKSNTSKQPQNHPSYSNKNAGSSLGDKLKKAEENLENASKENESLKKALKESKGFGHYWKNSSMMKKAGLIGIGTLGAYGAYSVGKKILGNKEHTNRYGDTYYS